jgi:hypothetical protein
MAAWQNLEQCKQNRQPIANNIKVLDDDSSKSALPQAFRALYAVQPKTPTSQNNKKMGRSQWERRAVESLHRRTTVRDSLKEFITAEAIDSKNLIDIASLLDGKSAKLVVGDNGKTRIVVDLE